MVEVFTLHDILSGKTNTAGYRVYVVRNGETVFYVGQSVSVNIRLTEHLGYGRDLADPLGEFIIANLPDSAAWSVELHCNGVGNVDYEEQCLIQLHRPCINRTHNTEPCDIPQRYHIPAKWESDNPYAEAVADLLGLGEQ